MTVILAASLLKGDLEWGEYMERKYPLENFCMLK